MFRDKGVADPVGHHAFDGFLVPAGHDDVGGDPRFFENRFIDGADPLARMADDKGRVVQLGDIHVRKSVAGGLSVSALRDLVVPGGQKHHSALQKQVIGEIVELEGKRHHADINGTVHQKLLQLS